ncbi:hypothetical protein JL100_005230 [Skermanella mucosa]|uniref:hypothetical protein n=1 Tax=Skermanella mucosa TaxID=1789672 RepID=UPI00192BDC27|nr:hypothetical protein [Skermanella mucosa]UEM22153.1 hypothetical protein JL100_005230 [Skermanella mucosa]
MQLGGRRIDGMVEDHFQTPLDRSSIRHGEDYPPVSSFVEESSSGRAELARSEDSVKAKVDRLLSEAGLALSELTQFERMVMAINRLEGTEQDETNRGLALLVQEGKLSHREAILLAVAHAKQR